MTCTADQWNAIAKFSAIEIEQPMPVAGLLVRHCVEHVRSMGIRLAQTLSELAVNARILLLERVASANNSCSVRSEYSFMCERQIPCACGR